MFNIEDMLEDGLDHRELWSALDACQTSLKGIDSKGAKAIKNMIDSAIDDIEMKEAMGEFDETMD